VQLDDQTARRLAFESLTPLLFKNIRHLLRISKLI